MPIALPKEISHHYPCLSDFREFIETETIFVWEVSSIGYSVEDSSVNKSVDDSTVSNSAYCCPPVPESGEAHIGANGATPMRHILVHPDTRVVCNRCVYNVYDE